jgi:hypothetical protein
MPKTSETENANTGGRTAEERIHENSDHARLLASQPQKSNGKQDLEK